IVVRSDGAILEVNRRAVLLSEKYGVRRGASWRSRVDELISTQRGPFARQRIHHPDGMSFLDLSVHRLAKESYAMSEDVTLIQLKETEREDPLRGLSPRRREIATLLVESGFSYKQIADKLALSGGTVRKNAEQIYRDLGVHSRPEL